VLAGAGGDTAGVAAAELLGAGRTSGVEVLQPAASTASSAPSQPAGQIRRAMAQVCTRPVCTRVMAPG